MKNKKLHPVYLLGLCSIAYLMFSSSSGGIAGKSQTGCGNPGQGCHNVSNNTTIALSGIPAGGYVPGTTYPLTLTISNPIKIRAGFNLSVNIGTLSAGAGMALNGTQELMHNSPKAAVGNNTTWTFNWTAPAAGNTLNVFVAGNAVDFTGGSNNDESDNDAFSYNAAVPTSLSTTGNTNIELYPNPVADYLFYKNETNPQDTQFYIVALNGATQRVNIEKIAGGHYKIQTATLFAGKYVMVIQTAGKKYYHHFSK